MILLLFSLSTIVLLYCIHFYKECRNFPPGFRRYPLIGNLPSMSLMSRIMFDAAEAARTNSKFSPFMGYFLGPSERMVVINDYEVALKVARDRRFLGRQPSYIAAELRGNGKSNIGVVMNEGPKWEVNRKLMIRELKEFFLNHNLMNYPTELVAREFVLDMKKSGGQDVEINQQFANASFIILWRILSGVQYKLGDPFIAKQMADMEQTMNNFSNVGSILLFELFPWIRYIAPGYMGYTVAKDYYDSTKATFARVIEEHKRDMDIDSPPKDFIDAYLRAMRHDPELNEEDLVGVCIDFFEAGPEAVGNTLRFLILFLVLNPEWQDKCQKEVHEVLAGRSPSINDLPLLPLSNALIMEVQRHGNVAASGLEHTAIEDVDMEGYTIKKGTRMWYNLFQHHFDEKYWGPDSRDFNPTRFLDPKKKERLNPGGIGKRSCAGQLIAKAQLFIFTVLILQHLSFSVPKDHAKPKQDNILEGLLRCPSPFHVHITAQTP